MVISRFSKTGSYHASRREVNQDCVMAEDTPSYTVLVLADGATGCREGREGAMLACQAAMQIVRQEGRDFFQGTEKKIAYLLEEHILYFLENEGHGGDALADCGSTLELVFIEKETGRCVMMNLGDGAVFSVKNGKINWRLAPRRFGRNPALTTTKDASRVIDVKRADLSDGERIFLCSDGFLDELADPAVLQAVMDGRIEDLKEKLGGMDMPDDCSYITAEGGMDYVYTETS